MTLEELHRAAEAYLLFNSAVTDIRFQSLQNAPDFEKLSAHAGAVSKYGKMLVELGAISRDEIEWVDSASDAVHEMWRGKRKLAKLFE